MVCGNVGNTLSLRETPAEVFRGKVGCLQLTCKLFKKKVLVYRERELMNLNEEYMGISSTILSVFQ